MKKLFYIGFTRKERLELQSKFSLNPHEVSELETIVEEKILDVINLTIASTLILTLLFFIFTYLVVYGWNF